MQKNAGLKYGFLGGVVVVFYFALLYFSNKTNFLNPWLQWSSMVLYLLFMYRATREDGLLHGFNRDFREMLRTPFVVFLLINLMYWLFYYSLHLADPELLKMETALQVGHLKSQLDAGLGDPQEANKIREQIQYLEKDGMSLPLGPVLLQMCLGAIGGFALAAGITALIRSTAR